MIHSKLLNELLEAAKSKKLVVVYGGRFQPFHKGHYKCYQWLVKKFGVANVWIATSNKTNFNSKNGDISPFNFKEKKEIITTLYDIDPHRIVQCKNPAFAPKEILSMYKHFSSIYVAAVGRKDMERYVGNFFQLPTDIKLPEQYTELLPEEGGGSYYIEVPMNCESISGTLVRQDLLAAADDEKTRKKLFEQYFGTYNEGIDTLIMARLKDIT